jgi:hypothetical protein
MDLEDSDSDLSSPTSSPPDTTLDPSSLANEVVDDQTGEADAFLNDASSLSSLSLSDGQPTIKPRPYQEEMVEESLKRNIIVAVSYAVTWGIYFADNKADGYGEWEDACVGGVLIPTFSSFSHLILGCQVQWFWFLLCHCSFLFDI